MIGGLIFTGLTAAAVALLAVALRRRDVRPAPLPIPASAIRPDVPWCVYFINLTEGRIGYVGKAEDPTVRLKRHEKDQARLPEGHRCKWWHLIDPATRASYEPTRVIWYPNRAAAETAERHWIRRLDPPLNVIKYKSREAA
jgi:GIY-YIG catalytic domain-containing protein